MELQLNNRHSDVARIPFIKGIMIITWGTLALFLFQSSHFFLIKSFGLLNLLAGGLTIAYALMHADLKISRQWLLLEAGIELIAGIAFTFVVSTMPDFVYYVGIGILFIIILQFIYGYALLNSGEYNFMNILIRFATLFSGVIVGVAFFSQKISYDTALLIIGIFSLLYGSINVQYSLQLRNPVLGKIQ